MVLGFFNKIRTIENKENYSRKSVVIICFFPRIPKSKTKEKILNEKPNNRIIVYLILKLIRFLFFDRFDHLEKNVAIANLNMKVSMCLPIRWV